MSCVILMAAWQQSLRDLFSIVFQLFILLFNTRDRTFILLFLERMTLYYVDFHLLATHRFLFTIFFLLLKWEKNSPNRSFAVSDGPGFHTHFDHLDACRLFGVFEAFRILFENVSMFCHLPVIQLFFYVNVSFSPLMLWYSSYITTGLSDSAAYYEQCIEHQEHTMREQKPLKTSSNLKILAIKYRE